MSGVWWQGIVPFHACWQLAGRRQACAVGWEGEFGPEGGFGGHGHGAAVRLPCLAGLRVDRHQYQVGGRLADPRSGQGQPLRVFPRGQERGEGRAEEFGDRTGCHVDLLALGGRYCMGEGYAGGDVPVLAQSVPQCAVGRQVRPVHDGPFRRAGQPHHCVGEEPDGLPLPAVVDPGSDRQSAVQAGEVWSAAAVDPHAVALGPLRDQPGAEHVAGREQDGV
ncbi:hypothetical protein [Streptomyces europaeiscabiei]|uniref:hypothetical protein n=1 Tax=Streptomyces europaeiscabiei TaxID=146819 RepID=UPI002E2851AE|nr:hypothetical protein [Streptomyces europaeiscabiei]